MFENKMFSRLRQQCKDKHYTCGKKKKNEGHKHSNIKLQGARRRKHHATEVGIRVEDKTFLKHLKKYGSNPSGGTRSSAPVQIGPGAHPRLLYNGHRGIPGDKVAVAWR
jgi:hypothetical protein